MKLAISCDHGGLELKEEIVRYISTIAGITVTDHGTAGSESVDYPDYARKAASAVASGAADRGILICGTGIGMSIAANRLPGVRAALCHDEFTARMSRLHNDANILVLGGRLLGKGIAREIVRTLLETEFEGDRHQRRLEKIEEIARSL